MAEGYIPYNGTNTEIHTETTSYATVRAWRRGNAVTVNILNLKNLPNGQSVQIADLPNEYHGAYVVYHDVFILDGSTFKRVNITINASGVITAYNYGATISEPQNYSVLTYVLES